MGISSCGAGGLPEEAGGGLTHLEPQRVASSGLPRQQSSLPLARRGNDTGNLTYIKCTTAFCLVWCSAVVVQFEIHRASNRLSPVGNCPHMASLENHIDRI